MSDRLSKIATALTWLIRIASVILGLLGRNDAVNASVSLAAGAFAAPADFAAAVAESENKITAGMVGFLASFAVPLIVQWIGKLIGSRPNKPGYVAVADRAACETLLLTRAEIPGDLAKVKELIASGVQLETQQRIDAVAPKGA